ncbi:putative phytochrome-like histidine kinase PHY2p [Mollisia scopiformis]|uniref:Putative phytochrome-like histidine kinase PHY2p n=1 Tax=Mollisia scopiformis TaxID=149040 RepID=A0A194XK57_MOLSC|nr:putative phytochrome-like histidine kinase PHY2p [Mollisia scopiformis]KUJ20590.1 putative phytochrome-like histidine kinase PHY2p [Mollisia scopiformis]
MSDQEPSKGVVFLSTVDFAVERVFPIRNLVAPLPETPEPVQDVESTKSTDESAVHGQAERHAEVDLGESEASPSPYLPPPYPSIPPEDAIRKLRPERAESDFSMSSDGEGGRRRRTERTQLVPATSGPPGVLPGVVSSETAQSTFYRCEDEPIHTPGAIQQYGALVALRVDGDEDLIVRIASENSHQVLQYGPEQLFQLDSFLHILAKEARDDMVARIQNALHNASSSEVMAEDTNLDVFQISVILPDGAHRPLWCAIHIAKGTQDLIICEFEEYSDIFYLHDIHGERLLPKSPISTIGLEVLPEERLKSTTRGSKSLKVLEIARRNQHSGVSSMDIFNAMTQAQAQLASAQSVQQVMDVVVGIIAELTGFHRVMFYRFDKQKNGCVDAEYINPRASEDLFRGLHFPASDIPTQARELYKINRIRILYDRDAETARLVCRDVTDFEKPLDLSHSYLRAMSPIHLKYLGNMGVRSSMSVSIVQHDDLWGLIACHGYGDEGIRVTLPIRELCRNIGECAATNVERLLMMARLEARKPPTRTPPTQDPAAFIAASSADLLRVFGADFGLLSIQDEARAIGKLHPYREALAILAYLQQKRYTTVMTSQSINVDFPDIKYPPGIKSIAGLLVLPLSLGGKDFIVFFRKGQLREIRWAGNPYEKIKRAGSEYLEPRTSFKRWSETVVGMSKEWTDDHMETAVVLGLLYGRFIEIWRQKETASQNNRMTRLLIRNSSHEVRTPLNAIVNYLEMALENKLDDSTREILSKAHKASRSLIYVIDDLLNLTKIEDGPILSVEESFDLGATVSETITAFRREAMRKGLDLTVSTHQGIPEMVKGDASRLRQVLSNLTSNAFQHSVDGGIKVDIRPVRSKENSSIVAITVQDVGVGMTESQLDELFQEFEEVIDDDGTPISESTTPSAEGGGSLGIGLAVVARYVRNMKGQIRVHSEPGKGTIFGIELPFEHAKEIVEEGQSRGYNFPRAMSDSSSARSTIITQRKLGEEIPEIKSIPAPEVAPSPSVSGESSSAIPTPQSQASPIVTNVSESSSSRYPFPSMLDIMPPESQRESLSVLIAEDNPINSRILSRRLLKLGHRVHLAQDGQECHDYFISGPQDFDVILMDIQMPLVNGIVSTQMIRKHEKELEELKKNKYRVPVIAVSASLTEENRFDYVQSGFDAWLLKPIDFGRLDFLLQGTKSLELKMQALYTPGHWEKGGWFLP